MQLLAAGQEMSDGPISSPVHSSGPNEPGGCMTAQCRPFHCSAIRCTAWPLPPGCAEPMTMQSVRVKQDTALRLSCWSPLGVFITRHRVPFRASANRPPRGNSPDQAPTARQNAGRVQDSPPTNMALAPAWGSGNFAARHFLPFHASANRSSCVPAARQESAETQDRSVNDGSTVNGGSMLACVSELDVSELDMVHRVPCHLAMSRPSAAAMHKDALTHDTPARTPKVLPARAKRTVLPFQDSVRLLVRSAGSR